MVETTRTAGVAGAGTMGSGIAITIARAGWRTVLYDESRPALDRTRALIEGFFVKSVERGKLTAVEAEAACARMIYADDMAPLAEAEVFVEAVFEDLAVKHGLFRKADAVCPPHTVFASNTSTLSITELAAGSGRPERFVGMHYCLPAQLMRLIEMSRGLQTTDDTWRIGWEFALATGQQPIETQDRPGFILNHFCVPYHNDAIRLVETGVAEPAEIDKAMRIAMGFAMGPCELLDLIGLDTQLRVSEAFFAITNDPRNAPPPLLRRMVAAGRLGRKSKLGFYDYGQDALYGG